MALAAPPVPDRRRVKVYELKNNDWFDRGTGFCTGSFINDEAKIHVQSEDEPERMLLETRITRDDGYQKQQDTLIVWTDQNVTDMALSFQEAEGCAAIWEFVNESQQRLGLTDDDLLDDSLESTQGVNLPDPDMSNLIDIEQITRNAINTAQGRDALTKFVIASDYIAKLAPLVTMAEDFESLPDLHRLCSIMKSVILLNDNTIMEMVVRDDLVEGVVGALEYDPDFPAQKANHRKYLADASRFKEVVKVQDPQIRSKIHFTYRLQYLKDVVLARLLDDPTFSVLNSLIFFNQVEIVQHVQQSPSFLKELFSIFTTEQEPRRKRDAVLFIQQCCSIAKGLQMNARAGLFNNFINAGLFLVVTFALKHAEATVRVAGTEILIALIDHDTVSMRGHIFKALQEKQKPLTDILIELLLEEQDLGVKAQMAEAIKVLLDPNANAQSIEAMHRNNADYLRMRNHSQSNNIDGMVQNFYDESAKKLFRPLRELENRPSMKNMSIAEGQLFGHLIEMLCFFVRQHQFRTKPFLSADNLGLRVAQLFCCSEKHLKLSALKYFRTCISTHDPFHYRQITNHNLIEPVLDILLTYMPKDNLLNSACLDFFEHIRREHSKELLQHMVERYREKLERLNYVETFKHMLNKYEQMTATVDELSFTTVDTETPTRVPVLNGQKWQQRLKDLDPEEESYFNTEDGDDEELLSSPTKPITNGASPLKPLVDYPEDDEEESDLPSEEPLTNGTHSPPTSSDTTQPATPPSSRDSRDETPPPPERVTEKRRRADDDEDELTKLSTQSKRRSSFGNPAAGKNSASVAAPVSSGVTDAGYSGHNLRRKRRIGVNKETPSQKKITISLDVKGEDAAKENEE